MPKAKEGSVSLAWKSSLKGDASEVYTFNITGGGFVIVSGDEGTQQEVLGWSDTGAYDDNVMPDGLRWLVGEYARMIAAYRDSEEYGKNMSRVSRKAPVSGYGKVEPLLRTTWGQDIDLYGYQYCWLRGYGGSGDTELPPLAENGLRQPYKHLGGEPERRLHAVYLCVGQYGS